MTKTMTAVCNHSGNWDPNPATVCESGINMTVYTAMLHIQREREREREREEGGKDASLIMMEGESYIEERVECIANFMAFWKLLS